MEEPRERRCPMNPEQARQVAESYIATQNMRGFTTTFAEVHRSKSSPGSWTVNFDLHSPRGGMEDGGIMVIVEDATGEARVFESL